MWFIKVLEVDCCGNGKDGDEYRNVVPVGVNFIIGHFMEKSVFSNLKYQTYNLSRKEKVSFILMLILNRTRKVSSLKWMTM